MAKRKQCQKVTTRKPSARPQGGGRFATVTRYLSVIRPDHPLADKDGRVRTHRLVLFEKIGDAATVCHWCSRKVHWFGAGHSELVTDHLDENKWNNDPQNLVPACRGCNIARKQRAKTRCLRGHLLQGENLYVRPDNGTRQCRTCKQTTFKRFAQRRKKREAAKTV